MAIQVRKSNKSIVSIRAAVHFPEIFWCFSNCCVPHWGNNVTWWFPKVRVPPNHRFGGSSNINLLLFYTSSRPWGLGWPWGTPMTMETPIMWHGMMKFSIVNAFHSWAPNLGGFRFRAPLQRCQLCAFKAKSQPHAGMHQWSKRNWNHEASEYWMFREKLTATIHAESTSQSGPRFYHISNLSATEQELSRKENALACSRTYNCKRDGLPFPTCSETRFTDSPVRNGLYTPSGSQISQGYRSKGICRPGQWCGQWC